MKTNTPAQQSAIDSNAAAILCIAGAGSGKSSTLVNRIKRLIADGVDPKGIVAISFTNAASNVLQERLGDVQLGANSTLHGFALRMLKEYGANIGYGERIALIDEDASADLMASKAQSLGCKAKLKDLLILKGCEFSTSGRLWIDQTVVMAYRQELRESGLVDFDGLLREFFRMLSIDGKQLEGIWSHLFVDEVQDSSAIDWALYYGMPMPNKFFVGDPDQAIYSFRGGNVGMMNAYANNDHVELIMLEDNFRSRAEICDAANLLIKQNTGRIHKETKSVKGPGGGVQLIPVALNEGEEIGRVIGTIQRWTPENRFNEVAVLARTNALCATFRDALKAAALPVKEAPKSDLPKDWTLARALVELLVQPENDALAYFYLLRCGTANGLSEQDARAKAHKTKLQAQQAGASIMEFIGGMQRVTQWAQLAPILIRERISAETCMKIAELQRELPPGAGLLDLALAMNQTEAEKQTGEGITVTTYHGAKGREWDVVFLVGTEEEAFLRKSDTPADIEEARRLFYVGLTRARQSVFISHAKQRKVVYGKFTQIQQRSPSRFISELS